MSMMPPNAGFLKKLQDMLAQIGMGSKAAGQTALGMSAGTDGGGGGESPWGDLNPYLNSDWGGSGSSGPTHEQNLAMLQEEARLAREAGREDLAIRFEQEIWKINRGQQLDLEKIGIQNKYDSLEAEKQRAFAAGETALGRKFEAEQGKLQREFQALESEKGRLFEKEMRQEELGFERQKVFSEQMGTDPVRAALYAMGVGGEILPGGEKFGGLPPMKGATTYAGNIEQALSKLLSGQAQAGTPGADLSSTQGDYQLHRKQGAGQQLPPMGGIKVGESGVTGLPGVIKSATAYQRGGAPAKTLLESAYGVGSTAGKGAPGMIPEETRRMIQSVTPKGTLQ